MAIEREQRTALPCLLYSKMSFDSEVCGTPHKNAKDKLDEAEAEYPSITLGFLHKEYPAAEWLLQ